jgi:hypothetical protein
MAYTELQLILGRVASAIHEWASNVYVTHRFRQIAGNIFDRFKTNADTVLASLCPEAVTKLTVAIERATSERREDWSAAALACRRVLRDFADALYPPRENKVDGRNVGPEEYKNRLWAFAKERGSKQIERQALALEEIDGLCKALDRVYDQSAKGIHADLPRADVETLILRTYILLSQLGQLASIDQTGRQAQVAGGGNGDASGGDVIAR